MARQHLFQIRLCQNKRQCGSRVGAMQKLFTTGDKPPRVTAAVGLGIELVSNRKGFQIPFHCAFGAAVIPLQLFVQQRGADWVGWLFWNQTQHFHSSGKRQVVIRHDEQFPYASLNKGPIISTKNVILFTFYKNCQIVCESVRLQDKSSVWSHQVRKMANFRLLARWSSGSS